MSSEAGSIVCAAVTVLAAVGIFVSIRKKFAGGALACGLVGGFAWLICFSLGGEVRNQVARDHWREARYKAN